MIPYATILTQPYGYRSSDVASYRERIIQEVSQTDCEWILWNCSLSIAHRGARASIPMPPHIPAHVVCICMNGSPLYWRKAWLLAALARWNDRLPAARFLPYDLLPVDPSLTMHLHAAHNPPYQKELEYILPILSATRMRESAASPEGTLSFKPSRQPAVSILMSIHNMKDTLGWSIRSVLAQSAENWELLIGDDGSEDESLEEACTIQDGRIRVMSQSRNRGKAIMMNRLLAEAKGHYILELDGDDWLAPETVALLSDALDKNPEGRVATGRYGCWERTRQLGPLWRRNADSGKLYTEWSPSFNRSHEHGHPLVPRMYRKSSLIAIGGWWNREDRFGRIFEDIDLTARLLKHSSPVRVDALLYHRVIYGNSTSQRNRSLFEAWYQETMRG
ncbi:Putative lipooligosaccharide biosynthesis protein [Actinobacillus pleuropneumoniae]|uniref:Glycosyltransferase family 2 protein n=3 Tax=Paenibacillus lautus TaxID=1401 RepID=A0A385TLV4_PAELA|nr:glycosyltransferase family 2 protein [Paenibacillus lautus]VTR38942.1 Putative lipooligosaccharide biosynthesis protein [Actinobacillus pleuropneumoniae]